MTSTVPTTVGAGDPAAQPPAPRRRPRRPALPAVIVLVAVLLAAMVAATAIGSVPLSPGTVLGVLFDRLTRRPAADPLADQIIWDIRFPRVLAGALAGAGLAAAGVCLQALVRNPLADPYLLGVSSGASLGAVLMLVAAPAALAGLGVTGAAFGTACLTVVVVFLLAQRGGRMADRRLILAGVAVAYLANAVTSFVQLSIAPGQLQGIMFWLMGSLAGVQWTALATMTPLVLSGIAVLLLSVRGLNGIAAGDDTAFGLGINVHWFRIRLLLAGSLLTAAVVSAAGGIGFVGLVIPHVARLLVGGDHRRLLPVALLLGAAFMVLVDLGARTLAAPSELPIGIITAVVGAPYFLYLLRRKEIG